MTCSEYERKEIVRNMSGMFLFPFELVDKFSKIVLYGAGNVGCVYYRQIQYTKYCEVTAWVDRDYEKLNGGIENPDIILQREFDFVVIAINDKFITKDIIEKLCAMGIDEKRIIWRSPQINENI
jgi:FlaA1/EpsC-like NDP-sugar epimerase